MSDVKVFLETQQAFEDGLRAGQLEIEPVRGADPYATQFRARVREGELLQTEGGSVPIDWANAFWKAGRDRKFERNRTDPRKPRIVAIGDSWYHYPFGSDLLEWFEDDWALLTFARAGDTLERMVARRDYAAAIPDVRPHFFMLSAGGNDVLGVGDNGERNIKRMVIDYDPAATNLLTPHAHGTIKWALSQFEVVRKDIAALGFGGAMVVHGYDHPSPPSRGSWLSGPLAEKGYLTDADQMKAVVQLVDTFNAAIVAWASAHMGVLYANCVGVNGRGWNFWFDEIHPSMNGYRYKLLKSFRKVMDDNLVAMTEAGHQLVAVN